jgi:tetratricopeptide (TPR) repeat protein
MERVEVNATIAKRVAVALGLANALLLPTRPAAAQEQQSQEQWVGRKFMPRPNAKAMLGATEIRRELHNVPLVVTQVNGQWLWIGKAWVKKSDVVPLEQADQYYTDFLRANPMSAWGYDMRGTVRKNLGQYDKAVRDFTQVIRYAPREAWGYVARGSIRELRGEFESALKDYAEAIRLAPQSPVPYLYRAAVWGEKNEFDKAMNDYAAAMRLDPQNSSLARFNRGLLEQKWGDYENALIDYTEAIRLDPENAGAWACRARVWATCPDARLRDGEQAEQGRRKPAS